MSMFENSLECDGECGTKITVQARRELDCVDGALYGLAEALGWKTVDTKENGKRKKKTMFFCGFCQERAGLIVRG